MTDLQYIILIFCLAAVTFIPRYLPFFLANRLVLPSLVEQALSYVPIAILTIIIVQTVVYDGGQLAMHWQNPYIGASLVSVITALVQKRLFVTIGAGLLSYGLLKFAVLPLF